VEAQDRIGTWCAWGIILLSWITFFLVLALVFRATGCNRSSEAGTQSVDIVAESVSFEASAKNGPLQQHKAVTTCCTTC
jgi:hypothetical protein